MAGVLRDQATAYVEGHNVMTLATHGPEGVWAAAVFYANDGFTLQFLSAPSSRHSRNIAASLVQLGGTDDASRAARRAV